MNWIQRYIETPRPGRMLPQPNREMRAYKIVAWLLRLR